jgi:DnaJ domain
VRARLSPAEAAAVLGVPLDAPLEDVQHAYLRAARQVHPDVLPDVSDPEREDAASRFDQLSQAREVLFEHRPVIPIEVLRPPVEYERGRGIGGSLAVLALLVFLLIAIVSLNDAFRARTAGSLDGQTPQVSSSVP